MAKAMQLGGDRFTLCSGPGGVLLGTMPRACYCRAKGRRGGLQGAAAACPVTAPTAAGGEGLQGEQFGGHCPMQTGRGGRAGKTDGAIRLVTA